EIEDAPAFVGRIARWLRLLKIKIKPLKDTDSGYWMFLIEIPNFPDIILECDSKGKVMTLFTNALTFIQFNNNPSLNFLIDVLKVQFSYPKARLCIIPDENNPIKLVNQFRTSTISLELLIEIIREYEQFLEKIKDSIVKYGLVEKWREFEDDQIEN
ncbi:MAG: hypothetical protein ACXAC7_15855, partial [Candidatus Hodarchaeales archaeon]